MLKYSIISTLLLTGCYSIRSEVGKDIGFVQFEPQRGVTAAGDEETCDFWRWSPLYFQGTKEELRLQGIGWMSRVDLLNTRYHYVLLSSINECYRIRSSTGGPND